MMYLYCRLLYNLNVVVRYVSETACHKWDYQGDLIMCVLNDQVIGIIFPELLHFPMDSQVHPQDRF